MSTTPGNALQGMDAVLPVGRKIGGALEQPFVPVDVEHRRGCRTGHRMGRVGVAMEELDHVLGTVHQAVVDVLAHEHAAHRHGGVADAFGDRHEVGGHPEILGREGGAEPAEASDDLVEDQQDAVLVADRAQPLEVALGRRQIAGRAGARLDDHGGDGRGIVQGNQPLELVGKLGAVLGLATGEGVPGRQMGMRQVIDSRQHRAELLAVVDHAADRDAAEADAMVAALAADRSGCACPARGRADKRARSSARESTASEPELQ